MQEPLREKLRAAGYVRTNEGRVVAGVIAGLSRRYGIDPRRGRLLFVLVLMIIPGSQVLVYPLLWLLMPLEPKPERLLHRS